MRVIDYNNGLEFLKDNEQILLEKEAVSQLLLFNAMQNKETAKSSECFLGKVVDDNGKLCFLFGNRKPYNCLIYVPEVLTKTEAYITLVDYLISNNYDINGINANKNSCEEFIDAYKMKIPDAVFKENLSMDIMELRKLSEADLAEGEFRIASTEDISLIVKWVIEFYKEAVSEIRTYDEVIENVKNNVEKDVFYLFKNKDGQTVSMAATTRKLINGVSMSYVYTPPEYRGKGYAATNMYYLGEKMLTEVNEFCCLFVDKKNPISNAVYKKIGYVILEDNYDYRLVK